MTPPAWLRYVLCVVYTAALVFLCFSVIHVNATTVALAMLLLVLGIATRWGLREAVLTSLLCVLTFNFFFLPPIGTLTIADPQNWVALTAFLVCAVVASQLSATAKTRAEEALARRSELERLYRLSRAMLLEQTDAIESSLAAICEIFGLAQVAFYDSQSGEIYPAAVAPAIREHLEQTARTNEPEVALDVSYVPVRLGATAIGSLMLTGAALSRPEQESIANLLAIGYERTRALNKAAEAEAAREGERLKRFVLDGIAHDLKTPLTAIKTCVTTLISVPPQSEEARAELLTIIDEETERLRTTITEAIQLARIESAKVSLQRTRVPLGEIFDRVLLGATHRHRVALRIPKEMDISADTSLLPQALRQVLENAAKYSAPDTPIEIDAEQQDSHAVIRISDRGPGISPREIDQIFDKFYRGTRTRKGTPGSGMGLAIARGIVEAHGGKIWAENRPGGGAVFIVQLPIS